jgi:enoyl-CoA hydratase/carnithine racemase
MTAEVTHPVELVATRVDGPVAEITIGNGRRRNAMTATGWETVDRCVRELAEADGIRAILIRGRDGTFCAGSDISEWIDAEPDFVEDSFARMESAFRAVEQCPVPVVAEIQGVAAGAGCQLALACDLRFMADSARIGMPIARLGILASPAFAARLTTLAGPAMAREMLYTGQLLDAQTAVTTGLVNRNFPDLELRAQVEKTLAAICDQPTASVRAAKRAVAAALAPVRDATARTDQPAVSSSDFAAAIRAFLQ